MKGSNIYSKIVILSIAKDLKTDAGFQEILHFVQKDRIDRKRMCERSYEFSNLITNLIERFYCPFSKRQQAAEKGWLVIKEKLINYIPLFCPDIFGIIQLFCLKTFSKVKIRPFQVKFSELRNFISSGFTIFVTT